MSASAPSVAQRPIAPGGLGAARQRSRLGRTGRRLAIAGGFRSVVLCECADQHAIVDRVDALRALPGVLNVSLVYHYAEPREALDAAVSPIRESGVAP